MKWHTFHKRFSNARFLGDLMAVDLLLGTLIVIVTWLRDWKPSSITLVECAFWSLSIIGNFWPFFGGLGIYRWRINQLFEVYAKSVTISDKLLFPTVKYCYNQRKDCFIFVFYWEGKVSIGTQTEIIHRLSEVLFPKNTYVLEEPVTTPAYTSYRYTKRPERLRIIYERE